MNAPSRIAPPFPLNPTVGERHGNWVWNGVTWVCAPTTGIQVLTTVFLNSGPYMPSPGLVSVVVECIGGGGGGGTIPSGQLALGEGNVAGGGASGGYARKTLPAALVAGGVQVTVGAGGAGAYYDGTPGNFHPAAAGQATTFGALCQAIGGMPNNPNINISIEPGQSQYGGVGDLIYPTSGGEPGSWFYFVGISSSVSMATTKGGELFGGSSSVVVGAGSPVNGEGGQPGTGAGGGGGLVIQPATGSVIAGVPAGGNGGQGSCVVTEYCWASASDAEDCMNPPLNVNARVALTHVPWTGPGPCPPGWGGYGEGGGYEE